MTAKRKSHMFSLIFSLLVAGAVFMAYQARDTGQTGAAPAQADVLLATPEADASPLGSTVEQSPPVAMVAGSSSERSTTVDGSEQGFVDGGNLVINGGLEQPTLAETGTATPPGWTSRESGLEFWLDGQDGIAADEGNQFIELNGQFAGRIAQEIEVVPGETYRWSFSHRARNDQDTVKALIDGELVTDATSLPGQWRTASGLFIAQPGQNTITFAIEAQDEGQFGNFIDNIRFEEQPGL